MRSVLKGYGAGHAGGLPVSWFKPYHQFTGTGVNDLTYTDTLNGTAGLYDVEIVSAASPNTFKWRFASGSWSSTTTMTGAYQSLGQGVSIKWGRTTGHIVADTWAFDSHETPLEFLEHGDWAEYIESDQVEDRLPAIFVKGLGLGPHKMGITGCLFSREHIRVVHVRHREDARQSDGRTLERSAHKARERYCKTLTKALFHDTKGRLATIESGGTRHEASLTCADTSGAQVVGCVWRSTDLGADSGDNRTPEVAAVRALHPDLWAIAVDLDVTVRTGGG